MLLPPELVIAVCIIQHIPSWLKTRTAWYRECFNISNYVLATLAAWEAVVRVILHADGVDHGLELQVPLQPGSPARSCSSG